MMRVPRTPLVASLAVLVSVLLPATAPAAETALRLTAFSQRFSRDVPVSGRALVGAVLVDSKLITLEPRLLARRTTLGKPLCVSFATRDGVYYGEGRLDADALGSLASPGVIEAPFEPAAVPVLRRSDSESLAMLATEGDCSAQGGVEPVIHLLDRRLSRGSEAKLMLMLNALNYTLSVEWRNEVGTVIEPSCRILDDARRNKAYNQVCELALPAGLSAATLTIHRRRYERLIAPLKFHVSWTAP